MFNNFDDFLDFITEGKIRKKKPQKKLLKEMALFQRKSDGVYVNAKGNAADPNLKFVLNRPSDGIIKTSEFKGKTSSYQHTASFLYGQLLLEMGIIRKSYRSSKMTGTKNKSKTFKKYNSIIFSFLDTFSDDDPAEFAYDALQETSDVFEQKIGFTPEICLNSTKNWNDLLDVNFIAKCITPYVDSVFGTEEEKKAVAANAFRTTQKFLNSYSNFVDNDLDTNVRKSKLDGLVGPQQDKMKATNVTPTETKVKHIKDGVAVLYKFFKKGYDSGVSLVNFRTRLQGANKIKTIFTEPDAAEIKDAFFNGNHSDIGDIRVIMDSEISTQRDKNSGSVVYLADILDDATRDFFNDLREKTGLDEITFSDFYDYQAEHDTEPFTIIVNGEPKEYGPFVDRMKKYGVTSRRPILYLERILQLYV